MPTKAVVSQYSSIDLLFRQLSAQALADADSARAPMLQALRAAAAELLDIEYIARTESERSTLVHSILGRLCAVADAVAGVDAQPAVFVTPNESRSILADCLSLCAANQNAA